MKIQLVQVDGFGCLMDVKYQLVDGMNIFFGPNEIGKSTLQQAILALLYGFYTKNRRNTQDDALLERFRPWRGAKFGGQLEYKLENNTSRAFRVRRDFSGDLETHLHDASTDRELSQNFEQGRLGRLDFAQKHWGLELPVFINTSFVRQADLHQLDEVAAKISETIINLADTGSRDHSVVNARALLERALDTHVGSAQARVKPLARAKNRLQEVEAEYARVLQLRQKRESDSRARQTFQTQLQEIENALARANYLHTRRKLSTVNARLEQIRALLARQAETQKEFDELAALADFPNHERDNVLRLAQTRETQLTRVIDLDALAEQARPGLDTLEQQAAPLRDQVRELEAARTIPVEQQLQVQELERKWNEAQRECNTARTHLDETARKMQEQRAVLPQPEADAAHWRGELEWLGKQRVAWQTARARAVEAEERENTARNTWRTRALAIPELASIADLSESSSAAFQFQHALDRANYLLARQELDALQTRMDSIEQWLTRQYEIKSQLDTLAFVSQFPLDTRDELLRLEPLWRTQLSQCAHQDELAATACREMQELEAQAAPLRAQRDALQHARTVPMERADEIRALQQIWSERRDTYAIADTQFQEIETVIARKQELKTVLEKYKELLAAPSEKFSALCEQWKRAHERAAQAQARLNAASEAWRAAGIGETEFGRLQEQLAGVDRALLDELNARPAEKLAAIPQRAQIGLLVLGAIAGIGGLILLALGNVFLGAGLLAIAILFLGVTFYFRIRHKTNSTPQVDARITARSFSSLQEMETAFAALQTARPLREELRASERALETARAELTPRENELGALLNLSITDALSAEMVDAWETRLRQWRVEISELAALGKTRVERDQRRRDAALARDTAAKQLSNVLAECGFGGDDDLERAARAFLTRCDERTKLEFLDAQLSFLNSQLKTKHQVIEQAENVRAEALRLENELRAILLRAQIVVEETDMGLNEYHRHAELAARYRALEQEHLALVRERQALTQTYSPAQMQTRRATLQAELTRLVAQHPEFDALEATAQVTELETTRAALREALPIVEHWRSACDDLTNARAQFANLRAEIVARLDLANTDALTDETLTTAEQQRQQWLAARRQLDALQGEWTQRQNAHETALAKVRQTEDGLRVLLHAAGLEGENLARDTRVFLEQCEKRKTLERVESELRALDAQIKAKNQLVQEAHDTRGELDTTENALRELLARAGIETNDLMQGVAEFEARFKLTAQRRGLGETLAALQSQLRAHLAGESLEQLTAQQDALTRECADVLQTYPSFEALENTATQAQLEQERARLEQQRVSVHRELVAIDTRLSSIETTRTVAEIEEELAYLRERIGTLTAHGLALNLAVEYLEKAADEQHRNFLPRLNQIVSESLRVVTDGRYQQVSIDHQDFQVRLQIPERAMPVTPDQLSRGAQEQIYLLLRLGLTELMSSRRERLPLILDDPLVNYDRARLNHALDFLADLAAHSQILLFTKDQAIVEWFEEKKFDSTVHKLHRMESSTQRAIQSTALSVEPESPQVTTQFAPNDTAAVKVIAVRDELPTKEGNDKSSNPLRGEGGAVANPRTELAAPIERTVPEPIHSIPPEARGGGNREKRWTVEGNVARTSKPELVCWQRSGLWQIGIELSQELAHIPQLTLSQDQQILIPDTRDETRWVLPSLHENILIHESENGEPLSLALRDSRYFIFKLQAKRREEGRRVRAFSNGAYMVVVPMTWRVYESPANNLTRQPEEIAIEGWIAHFIEIERGELAHIAFWDEQGTLVTLEGRAARFQLTGERIHDGDTEHGPLFGSTAPRIQLAREFKWPLIKSIVVGEEGSGENKWRHLIPLRDDQTEQSLDVIATHGTGWYFVRLYDEQLELVESIDFRFCHGLKKIALPESAPVPDARGYAASRIKIHHNTETFVTPSDTLTRELAVERDGEMTRITIPNDPRFDTTRWNVEENTGRTLEIVTRIERVWWAFDSETSASPNWRDRSLALALSDFDATSDITFWARLPTPRWAERMRLRIGREFRTLNARVNESVAYCALREFENVAHALPLGTRALELEIQRDGNLYTAQIGELRIAARCKKCDYEALNENDSLEHVRAKHLGEYFRQLTFEELKTLEPRLHGEIYKCLEEDCLKYAALAPLENPSDAINAHYRQAHRGKSVRYVIVKNLAEIRKHVFNDLLDADKCKLCGHDLKHPTNAMRWEHLLQKHRSRLFDRV